jgi:TonB family protein
MKKPAERVEKFDRWLLASIAFHAGIVVVAFVAPTLFGAKTASWGSKTGGNGGVNLKIVSSLPGIALPAPPATADESPVGKNQSIHKAEPETKTKAPETTETADLKLPSKNAPKKTDVAAATKTTPNTAPAPPSNAVSYGQGGGAPALRYGQAGNGPTGAEIGGDSTFGEKYGWYVDSMTRAISNEWNKGASSSSQRAPKVYVTFTISRDGRVSNPQLDPPSGQPLLDNAALRAVKAARLPALPPDYRGPDVSVRFYFDYAR